jgi:hypothetical protein
MLLEAAISLADFLNQNSQRFIATVLDFGNKGWVIIGEVLPDGRKRLFQETIADPTAYLKRVENGLAGTDSEYHQIIARWLSLQEAT